MASNNTDNVSVTKGVVGGYCYIAPYGTSLPSAYNDALNVAFENVGYVSDAGVTHSKSASNTDFYDLNGDAVESASGEITRTANLKLIEVNAVALAEAYGASNVTESASLITYLDNNSAMQEKSMVLELVLKNGRRYRRVIPRCKVTEWGDQVDVSSDLAGFDLTYTKYADTSGNFEYGYIQPLGYTPPVEYTYEEVVSPSGDPKAQGWYIYSGLLPDGYSLTTDTAVDPDQTYYIKTAV